MSTLRTEGLTKSYGGRTVVRGVSLEVSSGEVVGLLGPNGAGKTTTFYMTVGLTAPDSGRVTLDVDERLALPSDTSASILTSGVLGDQYIALEPGADETTLGAGDEIQFTQSAVILERLNGKLIQNLGSGDGGSDAGGDAAPAEGGGGAE